MKQPNRTAEILAAKHKRQMHPLFVKYSGAVPEHLKHLLDEPAGTEPDVAAAEPKKPRGKIKLPAEPVEPQPEPEAPAEDVDGN